MAPEYLILIVDDEDHFRNLFAYTLKRYNLKVETAINGKDCLEKVNVITPDLILLDVDMPVLDGFETIQELRKRKSLKHTPIIFLTGGSTSPEDVESGLSLGGAEYWTKLMSSEELVVRIRSILKVLEAERKIRYLQESFFSMVVHDLRNPLGTIRGFVELMKEDKHTMTPDQLDILEGIRGSSDFALDIVTDLLKIAELESGSLPLNLSNIDIEKVVERSLLKFERTRKQKEITLNISQTATPPFEADAAKLEEVFDNLLDNAFRFTPPKGLISVDWMELAADPTTDFPPSMKIVVEDTGEGIPEKFLLDLFDKNRLTQIGTRHTKRKTGLGLAICGLILEAHNGMITAETIFGKGTKIIMKLPLAQQKNASGRINSF
jgi:signal transduction histidine kinase